MLLDMILPVVENWIFFNSIDSRMDVILLRRI